MTVELRCLVVGWLVGVAMGGVIGIILMHDEKFGIVPVGNITFRINTRTGETWYMGPDLRWSKVSEP